MMVDLYRGFAEPLARQDPVRLAPDAADRGQEIEVIGGYRTHPMPCRWCPALHKPTVHFEAPPSARCRRDGALHRVVRRQRAGR